MPTPETRKRETNKALIVIPVYNEEETLDNVLKNIPASIMDTSINVLVIDDGSTDKSLETAQKNSCQTISHKKRNGYGYTVKEGLKYAKEHDYSIVTKIDSDGQHDPRYLATIIKILLRGDTEYVISSRYLREVDYKTEPPFERRLVNTMITGAINKITQHDFTDVFCGIFGLKTSLLNEIELHTDNYGLELELILKAHNQGANILEIPHPLIYTDAGSKFTEVFDKEDNLQERLHLYTSILLNTLKELQKTKI